MKTFFFSVFTFSLFFNLVSQGNIQQTSPAKELIQTIQNTRPIILSTERGVTIWSDDFSTPSNWSRSNTSAPSQDWYFSTNVNVIPVASLAPANMTTAANGFAFINSDSTGSGATQNANITLVTPIDLSTYPNVSLEFEHNYRTWQDTRIVRVSGDNGTTWTDFVITNTSSPVSVNSANPEVTSINISAVAGGQAQVLIQFNYQGSWSWYWAVDDVKIKETDANDLVISSSYWGSQGLPYFAVPTTQIAPIDFSVKAENIGSANQPNSVLTVDINNGVFTGTSAGTNVLPGVTDSFFSQTQYTPAASVGTQIITMSVNSDSIDATAFNNVVSDSFNITSSIYGRDRGVYFGQLGGQDPNSPGSFDFETGNLFDIFASQQVFGINVVIGDFTPVGTIIYGKIYELDNTGAFIYVDETPEHTISSAEATNNASVSLSLFTSPTLVAGSQYLVVVGCWSEFYCGVSGASSPQTSFLMYGGAGGVGGQYYVLGTPMVRLNFEPIPLVSFNTTSTTVNENVGTITVDVNITNPFSTPTTVDVVLTGGIATNGSDFNFTTPTAVTFPGGSSAPQTITLTIIDDIVVESMENIILMLQNPSTGAIVGSNQSHTISIIDNEPPNIEVLFVSNTTTVNENSGTISIYLTIANPNTTPTSVDVVLIGGTASNGIDFNYTSPTTVTFPALSTSMETVTLDIIEDMDIEGNETILLSLQNLTNGAVLGLNGNTTISITENDFLGVNKNDLSSISMYPNPASNGIITLTGIENVRVTMEVSNIIGQQVYSTKINANGEVNLQVLKKGTYLVTFISNKNRVSKRLIIN